MAADDGVAPDAIRAIIEADEPRMDEEAKLRWRFARAVLARDPDADGWRPAIEARWGKAAVVRLAVGIAAVRMYPVVKCAMGYGEACQRVRVAGVDVVPGSRAASPPAPA
jgi:hypothetical protein